MIVKNEKLLKELRAAGPCWWCGVFFPQLAPHHVEPKGMGGGKRLDVRWNLFPTGPSGPGGCVCHQEAQQSKIPRESIEAVLAARLGLMQGDIRDAVHRLLRAPKECRLCQLCQGIGYCVGVIHKYRQPCLACGGSGVLLANGEPYKEAS